MAAGDITFYDMWKQSLSDNTGGGLSSLPVDWDTDTIQCAVLKPAHVPDTDETTTQQHWDDVSTNQVGLATAYTGPITMTIGAPTTTGGVTTQDATDVTIAQDAGGFTDGRWLIFMKWVAAATSPLMASGDLGANKANTTGSLTFQWAATGLFTIT